MGENGANSSIDKLRSVRRTTLATFRCRNNKLSIEIQAWVTGGKWRSGQRQAIGYWTRWAGKVLDRAERAAVSCQLCRERSSRGGRGKRARKIYGGSFWRRSASCGRWLAARCHCARVPAFGSVVRLVKAGGVIRATGCGGAAER